MSTNTLYHEDYDFLCTVDYDDDICTGNCKECYQTDCPYYEVMNED